MNTLQSIDSLIIKNKNIRGGRPCLEGTTLRIIDLAIAYLFHQRTPDQLAVDYGLSLAQVHAGMAYYYQHKAELDVDIQGQIGEANRMQEILSNGRNSLLSR